MEEERSEPDFPLFKAMFDAAADGIVVVDERGRIRAINRSAQRLFGYGEAELLGRDASLLTSAPPGAGSGRRPAGRDDAGERGPAAAGEDTGLRKDGTRFPLRLDIDPFQSEGKRFLAYVCRDPARGGEDDAQARDSLTDCLGREQLVRWLDRAIDARQRLAVLFIDLDGFKQVNDNHGHPFGDRVLGQVAARLRDSLRDGDILARVGGDEFIACLAAERPAATAEEVAARLLRHLGEPFAIDGIALSVHASIGISLFPEHGRGADELIGHADAAMYQAKIAGKAHIRLYDQGLRDASDRRRHLLERLREAIALEAFELHYQPQFDLRTLRPCGLEALLRWHDGIHGTVPPGEFVPVAQKHGLMSEITRWVLRRACRDNMRLIERGLLDAPVAINLSPQSFDDGAFWSRVRRELAASGLPARRLELEIGEDVATAASPQALREAQALGDIGIGLVADNFGVGRSALANLRSLRYGKLKIDRSLVAGLPGEGDAAATVRAIVGIAQGMDMCSVAEGVETRAQLDFLRAAGCDVGQGFLLARPMPMDALEEWLRAQRGAAGTASIPADP
ncbi:MAG: EAL domain-containing protein [Pseudoxanthomonas sp.]